MCNIDHVTALTCVNGEGKVLPHMLIYAKSKPTMAVDVHMPRGWLHATSPTGKISMSH